MHLQWMVLLVHTTLVSKYSVITRKMMKNSALQPLDLYASSITSG